MTLELEFKMGLEYQGRGKRDSRPSNLIGFAKDLGLIHKYFTPEEATDFQWHAKIANEVASQTINVKFPESTHPNIHLLNVVKDLGHAAKGYAVPSDELLPRVITKLAFPNVQIDAPEGVDRTAFTETANEIIKTSERFYYLQALQLTLEKTGKTNVLDGTGTGLEMTSRDIQNLISSTQDAIQIKFDRLALISSGLTPIKIVNDDIFTRKALGQIDSSVNLKRVERTSLRMNVFRFSNDGLDDVRSAIITRHQQIRRVKIGASATVPLTAMAFCVVNNLKPPEITPVPQETKTAIATEENNYHQVELASKDNIQLLIDDCNARFSNECAERGITVENTKGIYFGDGNFLFNAVDSKGAYYFWHVTNYNQINPVDVGQDLDNTFYIGPKLDTYGIKKPNPDELIKYLILDPSNIDDQGNLIITYQSDGTPNTAKFFILRKDNPLYGSIKNAVLPPVESSKPKLTDEVLVKFEKAGIKVEDLDIQQDGLHINIEGNEEVVVKNEDLNNFEYSVNGVTEEIYQFLPVIDPKTNDMVLYSYDSATKEWFIKETLPLVKLSTDKNNPGKCTYLDVLSGNLARSIREQSTIVFPADAVNTGWDFGSNAKGSTAPIFLVEGSNKAMQSANICKMNASDFGLDGTIDIATVAVLNPDNTFGFINYDLGDNITALQDIFFESIKNGGFNTGIARHGTTNGSDETKSLPLIPIINGHHDLIINTIQLTDKIDASVSKMILRSAKR